MKIVFLLISILSLGGAAAGQQAIIKGKVTSFSLPVGGVTVVATSDSGSDYSAVTNNSGEYNIVVTSPGEYRLVIIKNNVQVYSGQATAVLVDAGNSRTTDFDLPGISEVVNIAADNIQPIEQVSKTVDLIEGQEMRERADFALIETLRTIPGFRVQQSGGFGRVATIKARGLRNQDTAVLIDGIRFRDPSAITGDASSFLSDFTLTSISKVEVLRGSGSSLYGTNAIGGVVDFQTPTARQGTHGQIAGAFGGLGFGRFRGLISHGLDNGRFGIGAGVSRTVYTKGIDGQDDAHNTNVQTRVDANPFANTNISGRIFFSDADVRLNVGPDTRGTLPTNNATIIDANAGVTFTPDLNDPDAMQKSRFFSGQISVNQIINSNFVLSGYYQGLKTRRQNDDGVLGPGFQSAYTSIFDGQIHTANSRVTWTAGGINTLTAGYEFEHEKFGNEGTTPSGTDNFVTRSRQSSNTFYVQNLVSLHDGRLQLSGAFRGQWFSLQRPNCNPGVCPATFDNIASPPAAYTGDASAAYYFRKTGTKLRAHVGNGYRVPSLYERFGSYFFFGGFFPLGNTQLKPERSLGIDGGIEQNLANDKVRLTATYFYTKVNDEVAFLPTDDLGASSYFNLDKHFSRGAEFSFKAKPQKCLDIFASYTFTNSDIRAHRRLSFLPPLPTASTDRKSFGVPDHQFTFLITQRYKNAWVNFDFLATSSYLAPIFSNTAFQSYTYRFGGNRRGDVTAGYDFGFKKDKLGLRIYGTIENVFDHEYYENGFRTSGVTARFGTTFSF